MAFEGKGGAKKKKEDAKRNKKGDAKKGTQKRGRFPSGETSPVLLPFLLFLLLLRYGFQHALGALVLGIQLQGFIQMLYGFIKILNLNI